MSSYHRAFASLPRSLSIVAPSIFLAYFTKDTFVQQDPVSKQQPEDGDSSASGTTSTGNAYGKTATRLTTRRFHNLVYPVTLCEAAAASSSPQVPPRSKTDFLRRYTLHSPPLGRGTFGTVYRGVDNTTGYAVAIKRMSANRAEVQALLTLDGAGGHPNICSLVEYFHDAKHSYLVMELVEGCEMFDHLVRQGAYSEFDAARLVREVGSALAFLHGLGMVHMDLKPENIMLSSLNPSNAVVKLIDFGCAVTLPVDSKATTLAGRTLAYCPPEVLMGEESATNPPADMFALGIHPFDLTGRASDAEVAETICKREAPPLRNSPITAHLSDSAIDLIARLMDQDPSKRMTANELLEHPWTRGITARKSKMVDAGKRLAMHKDYRSGISRKVMENLVRWTDESDEIVAQRISLVERSFRGFDRKHKGFLTAEDFSEDPSKDETQNANADSKGQISLSEFSDFLSENMVNRYFPKGKVVYREGDSGESMYFINSGTISVTTDAGSSAVRSPGDCFGEGAMFHPHKLRSATVTCETPVHAIEISREYFEKYLTKSDLMLGLREKDKIRKRNRAKMILRMQKDLKEIKLEPGEVVFRKGEEGDTMYLVQDGNVVISENGNYVFTATPTNVFGEYSVVTGRPRNSTAICSDGCILQELDGVRFRSLASHYADIYSSLHELCMRRDFKKAVVLRLKSEFPYNDPRKAFDAIRLESKDHLDFEAVASLMRGLMSDYTDEEIRQMIRTVNLTNSGSISYEEFVKVFIADAKKSASM